MYEYKILTTIPRNFDPGVEGVTLDSIIESCEGYVTHSVPCIRGDTEINITTLSPLDIQYLTNQLDDNFKEFDEISVVKEII